MRGKRPAFDPSGTYVARRSMLVAGVWLNTGDPIPAACSRATVKRLAEMRPPRIELAAETETETTTEGASPASGLFSDAERADELAYLPSEDDADPQATADAADSGREADPSAQSPIPGQEDLPSAVDEQPALPEGWRDLHGNAIKAIARNVSGHAVDTKADAIAVLEAYESGRAA